MKVDPHARARRAVFTLSRRFQWCGPAGADDFLLDGFSLIGQGYQMDYERLSPIVVPTDPNMTQLIAVAVVIGTDELSNALVEMLGNSILYSVGLEHSVMIAVS